MRLKLGILLVVVLMISSASATSIEREEIEIDLADNSVTVNSDIESITTSSYSYVTSVPVSNVQGTMNGEPIQCTASDFQIGSDIECEAPEKNNVSITMEFTASNLVEERNEYQLFQYSHSVYRPTDEYDLTVILPDNSDIVDNENRTEETVIPNNGEIGTRDGRTSVTWETEPRLGQVLSFQTIYEENVETETNLPVFLIALVLLASIIIAYIITREPEDDSPELESDEQEVVDIIKDNEGEMLQKDVVSESEYSKAKISGVVSSLVEKDVLTKEKEGRSNKLVLKSSK